MERYRALLIVVAAVAESRPRPRSSFALVARRGAAVRYAPSCPVIHDRPRSLVRNLTSIPNAPFVRDLLGRDRAESTRRSPSHVRSRYTLINSAITGLRIYLARTSSSSSSLSPLLLLCTELPRTGRSNKFARRSSNLSLVHFSSWHGRDTQCVTLGITRRSGVLEDSSRAETSKFADNARD